MYSFVTNYPPKLVLTIAVFFWIGTVAWVVSTGCRPIPVVACVVVAFAIVVWQARLSKAKRSRGESDVWELAIEQCAALPKESRSRIEDFDVYFRELKWMDFGATYRVETDDIAIVICRLYVKQVKTPLKNRVVTEPRLSIAVITQAHLNLPTMSIFPRRTTSQWLENGLNELVFCHWRGFSEKWRRLLLLMFGGLATSNDVRFSKEYCLVGDDEAAVNNFFEANKIQRFRELRLRRMELAGDTVLVAFDDAQIGDKGLKSLFSEAFAISQVLASK